ncbi:hypothetical protein AURDEDRAFT_182271 [Auricularia subglabra TFB-10046 SS5]|nr:hypothetical protein AURDEDRAFT_182271 [Auricularia subglabra TFB-10046 SS5]
MISADERLARRRALPVDLQRHEARRSALSDELDAARARRAEAAEASVLRAEARYTQGEDECAGARQLLAFDPVFVNALPVELLQAIWALVEPDRLSMTTDMHHTRQAAIRAFVLPCRLAAVCRRWRFVAVSTPELWSTIVFPPPVPGSQGNTPYLEQVERRLELSQLYGLDLLLCDDAQSTAPSFEHILRLVAQHVIRWRRVRISFQRHPGPHLLDELLLGCAIPMLQEFHVTAYGDQVMEAPWLYQASSLTAIYARSVRLHLPPGLQLSSVASVGLDVHMTVLDHLWSVLRAFPLLRTLCLRLFSYQDGAHRPDNIVRLGHLEYLTLRGDFHVFERLLLSGLTAPRLNRLNIEVAAVANDADWARAFFATFSSITHLEIVGNGTQCITIGHCAWSSTSASQIAALRSLRQLRSVSFIDCRFPGRPSTELYRALFVRLDTEGNAAPHPDHDCCTVVPPPPRLVWPELECVVVQGVITQEATEELLTDLVCFTRTRALACAERGRHFEFSLLRWPASFPSWFREALGSTLGPANVRLTTSDGKEHEAVGDQEDGSDESEAEFSDTDGTESSSSESESASCAEFSGGADDDWIPESGMKTLTPSSDA